MKLHRNSQKRIVFKDAMYFVTSKTHDNFPYFRERVFCDLFVENLQVCKQLKGFELYGWVLLYDHFHLLIQPGDEFNISKIMKSLKENVSCDANRILYPNEGGTPASRLQVIYDNKFDISKYKMRLQAKYPADHPFPQFAWQSSFHDHYIRNPSDFHKHLNYIYNNPVKHGLPSDWPYVFTNPKYNSLCEIS